MRLTVQDAAKLLGVSEKSIYRWIKQGTLPVYKVSEQFRFNRAELLAWAVSRKLNTAADVFQDELGPAPSLPTLLDALKLGGIVYRLEGRDRESLLRHLAGAVRLPEEVDRDYLFRLLMAREALGTTAVGLGLAVPQLPYPNSLELSAPVVCLAFAEHPVDFEALDRRLVHALIAILSPSIRGFYHLSTRLNFLLRSPDLIEALGRQPGREEVLALLQRQEAELA